MVVNIQEICKVIQVYIVYNVMGHMAACLNPSLALDFVAVIHIGTAGTWHVKFGKEMVCSKYCKCLYLLYMESYF